MKQPAETIKVQRAKLLEIQTYMNISNPLNYRELKIDIRSLNFLQTLIQEKVMHVSLTTRIIAFKHIYY